MIEKLITEISLDLYGETKYYLVSAKQYDKAARQIHITLLNNGVIYQIPSDAVLIVNVKKPDGKFVYNQCTKSGNKIVVEMTNQMLAAAGTAIADVNVKTSDGSQLISSASFSIEIEPSMRNEKAIISSNEMTLIDDKLKKIETEESIRVKAEKERISAEKARSEAEKARLQAESERIKAENKRQNDTSQAIANTESAAKETQAATRGAKEVTERAEKALYNQARLEQTVNQVVDMKQAVSQDKATVMTAKNEVIKESEKVKETIAQASVETAKEVLDAVKMIADEIKDQYGTLSVTADGGTPQSIDYLTIDGGSPMSVDSIKLNAGNPFSI